MGVRGFGIGVLVFVVVTLLSISSLYAVNWGGASSSSRAARCRGAKSRAGQLHSLGAVPRNSSLQVVLASTSAADTSWVQRAVDGIRAKAGSAVVVYSLPGGTTPAATQAANVADEAEVEDGDRYSVTTRTLPSDGKGQEAAAYLDAIIQAYPSLADVTVFLHGYSGRHSRVPNSWVMQRLLQRRPTSLAGGYLPTQCREAGGKHGFRLFPTNVSANTEWDRPAARILAQAWDEFLGAHLGPLPAAVSGPCCSEFAASASAIRRRPRAFYVAARKWILRGTALSSEQAERALELAWHLILQQDAELSLQEQDCMCSLYGVPSLSYWGRPLLVLLAVPPALALMCVTCGPLIRTLRAPNARRRPGFAAL